MDPARVAAVREWPCPGLRKELQRFLGFVNFYRRCIRDFSAVVVPLHRITSTQQTFSWEPEAERAFSKLKELFTSATILSFPDSARQFIVEVDASKQGVGAVLSQRSPKDNRVHPCAFFSCCLTQGEHNYHWGLRTSRSQACPGGVAPLAGGG